MLKLPLPILALALTAFAIGTTEFVIMGILPDVARDLGVSIPSAGLLVSGYALGVAVGAPLPATLTARWPRKATLIGQQFGWRATFWAVSAFGAMALAALAIAGIAMALERRDVRAMQPTSLS